MVAPPMPLEILAFAVELPRPFVVHFVVDQHAVAVAPFQHIFRIDVVAEADGIAAHPFEPPEPACEPVFESRCTQGPEIVMQAYPFDEDFTSVEFQPLLGRHFHITDAEGRFIKVRPAAAVSDPRTHGIELRSLRIPQLRDRAPTPADGR